MPKYSKSKREEARTLYLTGECVTVADIARRLKIKPHTVGTWKVEEDWDALRLKIEKKAAEQLVEKLASERVTLNSSHFNLWGLVVNQLFETMKSDEAMSITGLKEIAGILERAQRGQRLARGLSLDGQTEEQIRAEKEAESKALVDLFIDVVKREIPEEETRDRIARAIMDQVATELEEDGVVQ